MSPLGRTLLHPVAINFANPLASKVYNTTPGIEGKFHRQPWQRPLKKQSKLLSGLSGVLGAASPLKSRRLLPMPRY